MVKKPTIKDIPSEYNIIHDEKCNVYSLDKKRNKCNCFVNKNLSLIKIKIWDNFNKKYLFNDFSISGTNTKNRYFIDLYGDIWKNGIRLLNAGRFEITWD